MAGRVSFFVRVKQEEGIREVDPPGAGDGQKYLLGMGLIDQRGRYLRKALSKGQFEVTLLFGPRAEPEQKRAIVDALLCWGLLGGLGSRSRRGLGSVAIESLSGTESPVTVPRSIGELAASLQQVNIPRPGSLPPYTAFSEFSRIDVSTSGQDAWALLGEVGLEMMRYRGWGFDPGTGAHQIAGIAAEQNFRLDHDEMLAAVRGAVPTRLPSRAVFGLPHNYYFRSARQGALIAPAGAHRTRRASPLFIHAHEFQDGSAAVIQAFLPSTFLPSRDTVQVKINQRVRARLEPNVEWHRPHEYLDRFNAKSTLMTGNFVP